jgi:hypothetical protein
VHFRGRGARADRNADTDEHDRKRSLAKHRSSIRLLRAKVLDHVSENVVQ